MEKLTNKVAVITGGSSGIGLATAKEFIANGAKVVIFGRDQQSLDEATRELGPQSYGIQGDVTDLSDLENLYAETKSKFGGIDIVFVNVGQGKLAPIADTSETFFDDMINVNLKGPGIAKEKAEHLFKRYYRADENGAQYSGLGLGLYIAAEIVHKHGGEIGVDSELGVGSTFWFTLPAED